MWPDLEGLLTTANRAGCVVPYFVQIDSESVLPEPGPYSHPSEALVPVKGLTELPTGNAEAARIAALRTFSGPLDPSGTTATLNGKALDTRWVRVAPGAHPGSSAPLSWVLSDAARKDLRAQLALQAGPIQQVRSLIDAPAGALRCSAPGRP